MGPHVLTSWDLHYSHKTTAFGFVASPAYHWPYLREVYSKSKTTAIEIGCGRGIHSIFLSYFVPNVVGIDNNVNLVQKARTDNSRFRGRARFLVRDAFKSNFHDGTFNVCFSQGFLEHFTNEEICLLAEKHLRIARTIVASVPSIFYATKDRGDERLMSIDAWQEILKNFETRMFYYGFKPRQPNLIASVENLFDVCKILPSTRYKSHICMAIKKARS